MISFFSIAVLMLVRVGLAQKKNSTVDEYCPPFIKNLTENSLSWNSTGSISFQFDEYDDPWQFSLGLRDWREPGKSYPQQKPFDDQEETPTRQDIGFFLSVPESLIGTEEGNNTQICISTYRPVNATVGDWENPEDSCEGIFSDECYESFSKLNMNIEGGNCSLPVDGASCFGQDFSISSSTRKAINFSSSNCSTDDLSEIDVPDNYVSYNELQVFNHEPDNGTESFYQYDLKVRQAVPILIWTSNGDYKLVCLAPDSVVSGSREPEGDFPPEESEATSLYGSGMSFGLLLVTVGGIALINGLW